MSNLTDRVSYIRGLAEGMKLESNGDEGKVLVKIIEVLGEMAEEIALLREDYTELDEYVESIDTDLADMEEAIFGDEDDEDCECGCGHCHHGDDEDDDEDEDEERLVEYTCPHCGDEMTFEVDNFDFDEDYLCPSCHQPLFPETPDDEEEEEEDDE